MENGKKNILVMVDWFTPAYEVGGVVRAVANLVGALSDEFNFSIVTSNVDSRLSDGAKARPLRGVAVNQWTRAPSGERVFYFSLDALTARQMRRLMLSEKFDFLYVNSLFSPKFALLPLTLAKFDRRDYRVIIAPRGQLHDGALAQKGLKKKVFLLASKIVKLTDGVIWQATNDSEINEIKRCFGARVNVRLASDLPPQQQAAWRSTGKQTGAARFFFGARISPVKNIEFFLERLKNVTGDVVFDLFGALENENYAAKIRRMLGELPPNVRAELKGSFTPDELFARFADYHFSVLTTLGENFGYSIFESFSAGKPALISDKTPWRDLEKRRIGWDISLDDTARFDAAIERCVMMNQSEYDEQSRAAWQFAFDYKSRPELIEQSRQLFI